MLILYALPSALLILHRAAASIHDYLSDVIMVAPPGYGAFLDAVNEYGLVEKLHGHLEDTTRTDEEFKRNAIEIVCIDLFNRDLSQRHKIKAPEYVGGVYWLSQDTKSVILDYLQSPGDAFGEYRVSLRGFELVFLPADELCALFTQAYDLDLSKTMIEIDPSELAGMKTLEVINLSFNNLTVFPDFTSLPRIKTLILEGNMFRTLDFRHYMGRDGFRVLRDAVHLNVRNCGIVRLENLLEVMPNLWHVSLGRNQIRWDGEGPLEYDGRGIVVSSE